MTDYERIAEVIRYLDECRQDQPDLSALAAHIGLSSSHFHRLFSSWAGITPKDFLQCLTLEHARAMLLTGNSVLESALDAGLSGPGRLHDLCVTLQAATPGEIKSGGAGWTVAAGYSDTPFGVCLLAQNDRGICHLSFVESFDDKDAWSALQVKWPNAALKRNDERAGLLSDQIFMERRRSLRPDAWRAPLQSLKLYVKGTAFQVRVWRALLQIPPASFVSYGLLARLTGIPNAARAVGAAVGKNPIAYLIPCHRVIRETGAMGGYHWGVVRKKAIHAWENGPRGQ